MVRVIAAGCVVAALALGAWTAYSASVSTFGVAVAQRAAR
jgi:hypothetical protein